MNQTIRLPWAALLSLCLSGQAAEMNPGRVIRDVEYARVGEQALKLDLHLPPAAPRSPMIVWVHGGAWRSGSKHDMPLGKLVEEGYAVASVDYRLSTQSKFPAQVHDIKAAIRFVRGHGREWGLPTKKIVIAVPQVHRPTKAHFAFSPR
ncbi:MAG TPA: alpha/beta hydrolase [Verrucomicrobiae bacterium]|jgi:acetyl esterase/lipase